MNVSERREESRSTHAKRRPVRRWNAANPVVFTAVDGTLLDFDTFDRSASRALVKRFSAAGVPVVPITGMTLEEIEPIAREMGLRHAMIVEAGGAIARWNRGAWDLEPCGPDANALLDVVCRIEERSGAHLTVYSVLSEADARRLSGRSGAMLRGSTNRHFSEPFVVEKGNIADVVKAARSFGYTIRRGRRFFYLCRARVEGEVFLRLRDELRCDVAIALGGSPLDAEFLVRSEIAIVVPRPDGRADPELLASVPHARVAPRAGSTGWAAALEEVWPSVVTSRASIS